MTMNGTPELLAVASPSARMRIRDLIALTKARLSALVLATVVFGFLMAPHGDRSGALLLLTLVGVAFVAFGASALNQYLERHLDLRMDRTRDRPLPSGRMEPIDALTFGVISAVVGTLVLALLVNLVVALLAVTSFALYVFAYTPLKVDTSFHTLIGAASGALPPLMGWAASRGDLSGGAWILFAILFIWQLPHFFAIAWIYRDDYGRAGMKMLSVGDERGRMTTRQILLFTLVLIPVSLMPVSFGLTGRTYLGLAVLFGMGFALLAVRFCLRRSSGEARLLYLGSLVYLPCLLVTMFLDRVVWS